MKNIRLLEQRVLQAVERLKQMSVERGRLEMELQDLRRQLELAEASAAEVEGSQDWNAQRSRIATLVRDTLSEMAVD